MEDNQKPSTSGGYGGDRNKRKVSFKSSESKRKRAISSSSSSDEHGDDEEDIQEERAPIKQAVTNIHMSFEEIKNKLKKICEDSKTKNFFQQEGVFQKQLEMTLASLMNYLVENPSKNDVISKGEIDKFLQAGGMIENSVTIYCKKVDHLQELFKHLQDTAHSIVREEEDETEDKDGASQGQRKKNSMKLNTFEAREVKASINGSPLDVDKLKGKKYRPLFFPPLVREEQSEYNKKFIRLLNPTFDGDKTSFKLWSPLNSFSGATLIRDMFCHLKHSTIAEFEQVSNDDIPMNNEFPSEDIDTFEDDNNRDDNSSPPPPPEVQDNPIVPSSSVGADKENDTLSIPEMGPFEMIPDSPLQSEEVLLVIAHRRAAEARMAAASVPPLDPNETSLLLLQKDSPYTKIRPRFGECIPEVEELIQQGKMLTKKVSKTPLKRENCRKKGDNAKIANSSSEDYLGFSEFYEKCFSTQSEQRDRDLVGFIDEEPFYEIEEDEKLPTFSNDDDDDVGFSSFHQLSIDDNNEGGNMFADDANMNKDGDTQGLFALARRKIGTIELPTEVQDWIKKTTAKIDAKAKEPLFVFEQYMKDIINSFKPKETTLYFQEIMKRINRNQYYNRYCLAALKLANERYVNLDNEPSMLIDPQDNNFVVTLLRRTTDFSNFDAL